MRLHAKRFESIGTIKTCPVGWMFVKGVAKKNDAQFSEKKYIPNIIKV